MKLLNLSFKELFKYPNVELNIVKYRPIQMIINSEVENPVLHELIGYVNLQKENSHYFGKTDDN